MAADKPPNPQSPSLDPESSHNAVQPPSESTKRVPMLRSGPGSGASNSMSPSSTTRGVLSQARGTPGPIGSGGSLDIMAKQMAFHQSRMGSSPLQQSPTGSPSHLSSGFPPGMKLKMPMPTGPSMGPSGMGGSAPHVRKGPGGLAERRRLQLSNMSGNPVTDMTSPPMKLPSSRNSPSSVNSAGQGTRLSDFSKYIDPENGWITFDGAATITKDGVDFTSGPSFRISLDEIDPLAELGKGNYGIVYKVCHARPRVPRLGPGLSGFRNSPQSSRSPSLAGPASTSNSSAVADPGLTGRIMAMKQIRLELDENKFKTILKELVILHACASPFIIDFYGAFFQEGSVYMCIEYMDGGSVDQLYAGGIPEKIMRKITYATVVGLKYLKDKHAIIHRDVKPTNMLVNSKGQVKICDFGVSGNLVASLAKTQIGCQSYMAPERIMGDSKDGTMGQPTGSYSVSSDVWSLGLSIIECATGKYPYPPEISNSIFGQLNAIVEGKPSELPESYSVAAKDFVNSCLNKKPLMRPSYADLLKHAWIAPLAKPETIKEEDEEDELAQAMGEMELDVDPDMNSAALEDGDPEVAEWVKSALKRKSEEGKTQQGDVKKPPLHKVNLDKMGVKR